MNNENDLNNLEKNTDKNIDQKLDSHEPATPTVTLTARLAAILEAVPPGHTIADVGTDHGYLAAALIRQKKARQVIAIDVHKGPLESARSYIAAEGLENQVECRLGDGLQVTEAGELDGAVLCGMGGFLMKNILAAGPEMLDFYVLQPQNGQRELRQFLKCQNYHIAQEGLVKDMGKLYEYLVAVKKGGRTGTTLGCEKDSYDRLPEDSILWEVGALIMSSNDPLRKLHISKKLKKARHILQAIKAGRPKTANDVANNRETARGNARAEEMEKKIKQLEELEGFL